MGKRFALGVIAVLAVILVGAAVAIVTVLWRPDLLRGPIERLASEQLGRPVQIAGPIELDLGGITNVELRGIEVAAPEWAQSATLATVERLRVGLDVGAWLGDDRIVLTELRLTAPSVALERDAEGRTSWSTEAPQPEPAAPEEASPRPEIRALSIENGALSYRDAAARVELDARIVTTTPASGSDFGGLSIEGQGSALGQPVDLGLEVGSPLLLTKGDAPLPIHGSLRSGDSRLTVDGQARDALALDGIDLTVALESPDPTPLLALLGRIVPAGETPPLSARARLTADKSVFACRDLMVDWGESHVEGELSYADGGPRPRIDGRLYAPLLDLVALRPVLAAETPAEPDEAERLTPGPLATHDGTVELTVDRIRLPATEISDVALTARLQDGQLVAEPLRLTLPQGGIEGRLAFSDLDAGSFAGEVALSGQGIDLAGFVPDAGIEGRLAGELTGSLAGEDLAGLLTQSELRLDARVADFILPQLGGEASTVTLEAALAASGDRPVSVRADGQLSGQPLSLEATGGRLDALLAERIVYPLTLSARMGGSRAELDGTLAWPLTAGGLDMAIELTSDGLDLARILGEDAAIGGVLEGHSTGRLSGGSLTEILAQSRLDVEGQLTELRLPQFGERLETAALTVRLTPEGEQPLQAKLTGRIEGEALEINAIGGNVDALRGGETDYPVRVDARLAETRATADGTVAWPLERGGLSLAMTVAGPDPAQVLEPLGLPAIALPPYELAGELHRDGATWRLGGIDGRVGDSDVTGELGVDLGGERPALTGSLHSRTLDLDDLLGLVGSEPATGAGETASGEQRAEARAEESDDEVLPEQRFDPASWRRLDVDVALKADQVRAGIVPLDSFDLKAVLEDGRLRVDPLLLRLGEGRLDGMVAIDGRRQPAAAEIEVDLVRLPVARLLRRLDIDMSSVGTLSGRARGDAGLAGRGASVAEILGSADGAVTLIMEGGTIDRQLVDLLGFDFLNLFGSLLGTTPSEVTLTCTLADLAIKDGIVATRALVVDTEAASLAGEGTLDLESEAIDLELLARPKGAPLPSGRTGITIGGTLAEPEVQLNAAHLAARGAMAATFGVFLRPFTALASTILPEAGQAQRSACAELLQGERAAGG
jgi:uncharacterized protein involved in outer membrane biogenesis